MQEVAQVLQELAAQLGTTVEHLWPLLVRKELVFGILDLALWTPFLLASVITPLLVIRRWWKAGELNANEDYGIVLGGVAVAAFVLLFVIVHGGIMHVLNPEAYALQAILGAF